MITAVYYRDTHEVEISGHAQSGEAGHDLVCASASILTYTLAQFVRRMKEAGQLNFLTIELTEGHALVSCSPLKYRTDTVRLAFDTVCAGFELLARDYPDNISYEIREMQIE